MKPGRLGVGCRPLCKSRVPSAFQCPGDTKESICEAQWSVGPARLPFPKSPMAGGACPGFVSPAKPTVLVKLPKADFRVDVSNDSIVRIALVHVPRGEGLLGVESG